MHCLGIANIAVHEAVASLIQALEVVEIAGVGQGVEVCDFAVWDLIQQQPDKRRPNESRPAGNKYLSRNVSQIVETSGD